MTVLRNTVTWWNRVRHKTDFSQVAGLKLVATEGSREGFLIFLKIAHPETQPLTEILGRAGLLIEVSNFYCSEEAHSSNIFSLHSAEM